MIVDSLIGTQQAAAYLLLATGARAKDLQRLRRKQLSFHAGTGTKPTYPDLDFVKCARLRVRWRVTKSRRQANKSMHTTIPAAWSGAPPKGVIRLIKFGDPDDKFLSTSSAAVVNKVLREACGKLGQATAVTTRSFRRAFVQHALTYTKGSAAEAATLTGHLDPGILDAFYTQ